MNVIKFIGPPFGFDFLIFTRFTSFIGVSCVKEAAWNVLFQHKTHELEVFGCQ